MRKGTHLRRVAGFCVVIGVVLGLVMTAPAAWADDGKKQVDPCNSDCPPCDCDCYPPCECSKPKKPKCPPKYHNLRFEEDWKPCLCVPCCERDHWSDRIKAVCLTRCPLPVRIDTGGQIRVRLENFENFNLGNAVENDDGWALVRARAHVNINVTDCFRVFVEGIWADQYSRTLGPRPIDVVEGDLLNGFAEYKGCICGWEAGLWGGRRELQFGKQVLISPLDWANTRRTFQGGGAFAECGGHRVDAFWTRRVLNQPDQFNEWDEDGEFFGVYYQNTCWTCVEWDAYFLGLFNDPNTYQGTAANERRYTVGARGYGKIPGTRFDWIAEGGFQFGTFGDADIAAWFALVDFGYRICNFWWKPRVWIGADYASGDSDPLDGTQGTFNQLFPLAHKYLGIADLFARQNIVAARFGIDTEPAKGLKLFVHLLGFWRANDADDVYNVAGGVLRPAAHSTSNDLGVELDVFAKWALSRQLTLFGGWAHFFAGDFFGAAGDANDEDFFYAGAQYTF